MTFNRHDMLFLDDSGREEAAANMAPLGDCSRRDVDRMRRLILAGDGALPAVARRAEVDECRPGHVPVGFSSPFTSNGVRIRVASRVRPDSVRERRTPYDVFAEAASGDDRLAEALRELSENRLPGRFGIWGSAAQQAVTGRRSWSDGSDLDLIVVGFAADELRTLSSRLADVESQFSIDVDVEVDLGGGDGVNMNELLSETKTCLVKGNDEVKLVQRSRILANL